MTAPTDQVVVDQPGIYQIDAADYHRDPVPGGSLSSSGARRLLPPGCPALYRYERDYGQPRREVFDFGRAAHRQVLGAGDDIVVVDAEDWRTKAAKQARDEAYEAGKTPILAADKAVVDAMAAALRRHPIAAALLRPDSGTAEQALFWVDKETRVWCRALVDWLPDPVEGRRLLISDYKTCVSAAPDDLVKAVHQYGYHQQADWYLSGVKALGLDADPQFLLIAQEKTPPYLVTVAQPDPTAMAVGAHLNRMARITYRECTESGRWPGHADDVVLTSLPAWVENRYAQEIQP